MDKGTAKLDIEWANGVATLINRISPDGAQGWNKLHWWDAALG